MNTRLIFNILATILVISYIALYLNATYVLRQNNGEEAELKGLRVVFSLANEKLMSRPPIYIKDKIRQEDAFEAEKESKEIFEEDFDENGLKEEGEVEKENIPVPPIEAIKTEDEKNINTKNTTQTVKPVSNVQTKEEKVKKKNEEIKSIPNKVVAEDKENDQKEQKDEISSSKKVKINEETNQNLSDTENNISLENDYLRDDRKLIAIIVKNLGLSKALTDAAIKLPGSFSLGMSPYSYDLKYFINLGKRKNHNVLINIPLEPKNYPADDPGPKALITDAPQRENIKRIVDLIRFDPDLDGFYTDSDEKYTRSILGTRTLVTVLKRYHKYLVFGLGAENSIFYQVAEQNRFQVLTKDLEIDSIITEEAIKSQLDSLTEIASNKGFALAYANPYPITIKLLKEWSENLDENKFKLVPVDDLEKFIYKDSRNRSKKVTKLTSKKFVKTDTIKKKK